MNPIRIREKVDALRLAHGCDAVCRSYPLLSLPAGWSFLRMEKEFQEVLISVAFAEGGVPRVPFQRFLLAWPGDEVAGPGHGYVWADGKAVRAFLSIEAAGMRRDIVAEIVRLDATGLGLKVFVPTKVTPRHSQLQRLPAGASGFAVQPVLAALWYYLAPSMQPVRVEPEGREGKSVEWVRARAYYSVVHRRHAANRREVPVGATVADKTKILTAHARRAHARILRSPKWGASMGKRVWVRSAWVGPKEWQDAESKQIYRVVDIGRADK